MTDTHPQTRQLVRRAAGGDRDAFAELVRCHHAAVLGVARAVLAPGEAEEAVQDAWLAAWQHLASFEGRAGFRTWLTRIVINECRMRLRRGGRELNVECADEAPHTFVDRFAADGHWHSPPLSRDWHTPEQLLEERDLRLCLERNMARLPPRQRMVLELRELQGLSLDDICNLLDISTSNVRVLLHRARARLFAVVEHYQETGEC